MECECTAGSEMCSQCEDFWVSLAIHWEPTLREEC